MSAAAILLVTEITPCPPSLTNSRPVASSPLSRTKPSLHISRCFATRLKSPVASFSATMFLISDKRATVSGRISTAVRPGTLYKITGISVSCAIAL
ncbi:Uncharacterised protein [Vibrio cholerae]|nr:Uncharacterised protein [Vibrio cholerae]